MSAAAKPLRADRIAASKVSRVSRGGDRRVAARTLASAFANYPISTWLLRDSGHRDYARSRLFEVVLDDLARRNATIELVADGVGASAWIALRHIAAPSLIDGMRPLLYLLPNAGLRSAARLLRMERVMAEFHPSEPHIYLFLVGVKPEYQGRGFGSQLIRSCLAGANAQGYGVFLETSSPANVPIYEHFGFKVRSEYLITRDSPPTWTMWHPVEAGGISQRGRI